MSTKTVEVKVDYVSRVEGHGNIVVVAEGDEVKEVRFEVTEPPRFFEAMLRGRPYEQAPLITSRICGICSNGHVLAAITAMEAALGLTPSHQTMLLRRLLLHGETIQSHVLHSYFLVAPDFFGLGSVVPLVETHPDVVRRALRMKKLGNDICDVVGGRAVHQIAAAVGGFTHLPTHEQLESLRARLDDSAADLQETVALFAGLEMPHFERPTEYLSLRTDGAYAFFGDEILSSHGDVTPVQRYREKVKERVVAHSSAKHCRSDRETFMVGALARLNNGFDHLADGGRQAALDLGFRPGCANPFMNTVAQLIETVHCVADAAAIISELLETGLRSDPPRVTVREGHGAGAVEVPRGTLYHEYGVDSDGLITEANLIIPTGQNLANLEQDMWALAPQVLPQGREAAQKAMEMLVRAYDPCISCSTHVIYLDEDGAGGAGAAPAARSGERDDVRLGARPDGRPPSTDKEVE